MTWDSIKNALTYERIRDGIIAVALVAFVVLYIREHDARVKAEADDKVRDAQAQQLTNAQKARDDSDEAATQQAAKQSAAITTPQAATSVIIRHLKPTLGVDQVRVQPSTQPTQPNQTTPEPDVVLTADAAQQIAKQQIACDLTTTKLNSCQQNYEDEKTKTMLANKTADEYKAALKGGTKTQRIVKMAKIAACAGGGAAAGAAGGDAKGAAIGAVAGAVLCSLI